MKLFFAFALAALTMLTALQADNRTPINKGVLQSNLDGNQQSITNLSGLTVGTLAATNLSSALTNLVQSISGSSPNALTNKQSSAVNFSNVVTATEFYGKGFLDNGDGAITVDSTDGQLWNSDDNTLDWFNSQLFGVWHGSGAGWTALNASELTGTVADARLSSNIPLKDANNVFTGHVTATNLQFSPNTNRQTLPLLAPIRFTNATFFGYGTVYSNGYNAGAEPDPVFVPLGGTYYGLTITNSPAITRTLRQAAMGFNISESPNGISNITATFYDLKIYGSISNGNAVSWKTGWSPIEATNDVTFYNSEFHAGDYAFNLVGKGVFRFFNCWFDAVGPCGAGDSSIAFLPDQGPVTNYLYGCRLTARNGSDGGAWAFLEQVDTYNYFEACTFEASDAGALGPVVCITSSGEGKYVTECHDCRFKFSGGTSALAIDLTAGGLPSTLVLNNCFWEGPGTAIVDNASSGATIKVMGGNFQPKNFTEPSTVTFIGASVGSGGINWFTNSTPPLDTGTIKAWMSVTNDGGKPGKVGVYY